MPVRFREEDVAALNEDGGVELLPSEVRYIAAMREIHDLSLQNIEVSETYPVDTSFVGMGIDGGFDNTVELHALNDEAMSSDNKQKWMQAVNEEHERMLQHKVTEAKLAAATSCAQFVKVTQEFERYYDKKFKVQLSMIEVDNTGAEDVSNNWSVGGRLRHINVRKYFLRDLIEDRKIVLKWISTEVKEDGKIVLKWISTEVNSTDMFTKNLRGPAFEQHAMVLISKDKCME